MTSRNSSVIGLLAILILLCAGAAAAFAPFPDAETARQFDRIFAEQGARSLNGRVVPGLIEIQFETGAALPADVMDHGRSGRNDVDRILDGFGAGDLTPLFFASLPADRGGFGDFRDRFYQVEVDPATDIREACLELSARPGIRTAWPVLLCEAHRDPVEIVNPNDPSLDLQYYLKTGSTGSLKAKGGWGHSLSDSTAVVAVLDTGIDMDHPDLAGPAPYLSGNLFIDWTEYNGTPGSDDDSNGYVDDWRGWDFVHVTAGPYAGEDYRTPDNDPDDFEGHGTLCAGFVSAICDNGVGIASVGWNTRILPVRIGWAIEDNDGQMTGVSYSTLMASGFNYARIRGAHVANLSYGSSYTPSLATAVNAAWSAGMIMTVSAGNDGVSTQDYLAGTDRCVDVAATTSGDLKADFSNFGAWVDCSAPGEAVYSTAIGGYASTQGTSFSAPLTAGLLGNLYRHLVGGVRTQANAANVTQRLFDTCDDIDDLNPGYHNMLGAGRINAFRALGGGSFFSFPDQFTDLQEALTFADEGDTVALKSTATGVVDLLHMDRNIALLGAWDDTYDTRAPATNRTVLTGNGINPLFVSNNAALDASAVIDGFVLRNGGGQAGYYPDQGRYGGAMLIRAGTPTLSHLTFANSDLSDEDLSSGAGLFVTGVDLTITDCRFENNLATRGGGFGLHDANVVLDACTFDGNSATNETSLEGAGGAVWGTDCALTVTSSVFTGNSAIVQGGAVQVDAGETINFDTCLFDGNTAEFGGAACVEGELNLSGCTLSGNLATERGGALLVRGHLDMSGCNSLGNGDVNLSYGGSIYAESGGSFSVRSNVFRGDNCAIQGAALYANGASGDFVNNTVDAIPNAVLGCAVAAPSSAVDIRNCQFTNNGAAPPIFSYGSPSPTASYNNFFNNNGTGDYQGVTSSGGDTHVDPLYLDQAAGNLHLLIDSPSLDAGDPAVLDVDGGRSDIGAYGGPDALIQRPWRPEGLQVDTASPTRDFAVKLSWEASAGAAGYAVYRDTVEDFTPAVEKRVALIENGATTYYDDPVPDDTTEYFYKVSAFNGVQLGSGYSDEVSGFGQVSVGIIDDLPVRFALGGAWPNPFNPTTTVAYALPEASDVSIRIFAIDGRQVASARVSDQTAGDHTWTWNGRGADGRALSSGIYTLRIEAGRWSDTAKLTLLK